MREVMMGLSDLYSWAAETGDFWLVEPIESLIDIEGYSTDAGFAIDQDVDDRRVPGNIIEVKFFVDDALYRIYENYEVVEVAAENRVGEMLEEEPELFNREFIERYAYISDTDKRMIALDEADAWVGDLDDDELLDRIELEFEDASRDLLEMVSRARELIDEGEYSRLRDLLSDIRSKLYDEYVEYVHAQLEDDWMYYFDWAIGLSWEELLNIQIDIPEAVKDAVAIDGPAHFLDSYDGRLIELRPTEAVAIKVD